MLTAVEYQLNKAQWLVDYKYVLWLLTYTHNGREKFVFTENVKVNQASVV